MNLQFHLTNGCNLRCKHCYQGEYDTEIISLDDFVKILSKTKSFFESIGDTLYSVNMTGGEPLIIPDFTHYLYAADSFCQSSVILSNGLLLSPSILDDFRKSKTLRKIQVSLEGPQDINDSIRGIGTYQKILQAIRYIKSSGLLCSVSCTLAPYNYDRITELYDDLLLNAQPDVLWFDRCIPFKDTDILTKEQFRVFIQQLRELRQRWRKFDLHIRPVAIRALQWLADDKPQMVYSCGAGLHHFTVMHNGDVMICRRLNFSVGNLLKEDWSDILQRIVPTLELMHKLPDECSVCVHSSKCNGGLKCLTYSQYGVFNHRDINCFL